jgi:multidrug efflux system outer membrane protein
MVGRRPPRSSCASCWTSPIRPAYARTALEQYVVQRGQPVTRARWDPSVPLIGSLSEDTGFGLASLLNALWAFGAYAVLALFEGGLRKTELQQSWSQFYQATDSYRATLLQAFEQVEDNLTSTGKRVTEAAQQEAAPQAVVRAQNMSFSLYTDGLDNYLNVTVAQIAALTAQIAEVQVQTRRLQTAIALIGAFGGGWSAADLPTGDQSLPFNPLSPHDAPGDVHEPH